MTLSQLPMFDRFSGTFVATAEKVNLPFKFSGDSGVPKLQEEGERENARVRLA